MRLCPELEIHHDGDEAQPSDHLMHRLLVRIQMLESENEQQIAKLVQKGDKVQSLKRSLLTLSRDPKSDVSRGGRFSEPSKAHEHPCDSKNFRRPQLVSTNHVPSSSFILIWSSRNGGYDSIPPVTVVHVKPG